VCDRFQTTETSKDDAALDADYLVSEEVQFAMLEESFKEVVFICMQSYKTCLDTMNWSQHRVQDLQYTAVCWLAGGSDLV